MFLRLCWIVGALLSGIITVFSPVLWYWFLPLIPALAVGLCLGGILFLFICSLFCYGNRKKSEDNSFLRFLSYYTMDAILALFRFSFSGEKLESIPAEPCVIVCNHLSRFDPMVTFCLMKGRRLGFISKKENLRIPIAGPIISKIGFLPLDRENPLRAMRTIHAAAKLVSGQGYTMGIYPEGTRSYDGTLLEFKTGAFVLAKKASAPIVISVIEGTNQYKKNWPWRRTPVSFRVLDVIAAQQVQSLCAEELSDRCRETILKAQKEREVTPSA